MWPGQGGWVYIPTASNGKSSGGSSGKLDVYKYGTSAGGQQPTLALAGESSDAFGFGSGAPVITSSGTTAGSALVWTEWMPNGGGGGAQLRAYDPLPVEGKPSLRWSAPIGTGTKFATPGVGEGRLYVGTRDGHVLAFGSPVKQPLSGPPTEFPPTTIGSHSEQTVTLTANEGLEITALSSSDPSEFELGGPTPALTAHLGPGQNISIPSSSARRYRPAAATLTATLATGTKPVLARRQGADGARRRSKPPRRCSASAAPPWAATSRPRPRFTNVGASSLEVQAARRRIARSWSNAPRCRAGGMQLGAGQSITIPVSFDPTSDRLL